MPSTSQLVFLAGAVASVARANTLFFVSQDDTDRTVICTPSADYPEVGSIEVAGGAREQIEFPDEWIGNCHSESYGAPKDPNGNYMLAEVTFNGHDDKTYYDVSAIVNPNDKDGVKMMYPLSEENKKSKSSFSGCEVFPCDTVYQQWDDVQTQVTDESSIVVTLGGSAGDLQVREPEAKVFPRRFVLGAHY